MSRTRPINWEHRPESLRAPAMLCAFEGWNDAGGSASAALDFLIDYHHGSRFATIDPDEFLDYQAARPKVTIGPDSDAVVAWPEIELFEVSIPRAPRDLIILRGPEPAMRWRGFCATVIELAEVLGVQMVVGVGSLLADVPHSRPVSMTGLASDESLLARLDVPRPEYEGPTGILGVIHTESAAAGIPSASLWAAVPHYVAVQPNPKGALALLRKLELLVGVTVNASELESAAQQYEDQVSRAVELDGDVQAFVERLEQLVDAEESQAETRTVPSGEVIAREFQRFLRQQGD